ncbi:MAG: dipicolinate synthase [Clostridiales bacterium]|nr:dipicolinate synthase [Clostridiales bacterium]
MKVAESSAPYGLNTLTFIVTGMGSLSYYIWKGAFFMERHSVVFVTDQRQLYISEFLGRYRRDVRETELKWDDGGDGLELIRTADQVVFPTPVPKMKDYRLDVSKIRESLTSEQAVFGGKFPEDWKRDFACRGIACGDLMEDEKVALANADITAEAVVAEVIRRSPWSVSGQKIIITGYGRCAKAAALRLAALGAKITVLARSKAARKEAREAGYVALDFACGPQEACAAGTLINTVPACVVTGPMFKEMQRDILILDIASSPGGCDITAAGEYGITVIPALSLPAIYTTKSSAKVLSDAIIRKTPSSRKCMGEKTWIYQILRSDMA